MEAVAHSRHNSKPAVQNKFVLPFKEVTLEDVERVGGKNAALGDMIHFLSPYGIAIPQGFAITTDAFFSFLEANGLQSKIGNILQALDRETYSNLHEIGVEIRTAILSCTIPSEIRREIEEAYQWLSEYGDQPSVAIRSSATAEDTETASFAGQHESYLNVTGIDDIIAACIRCFASLYTDRAIEYREHNKIDHISVGFSVGVQQMVRADKGASGVAFTIDPDTGFDRAMLITGTWGLGESIVQGIVVPDEFILFKPALELGNQAVISKKLGSKEQMLVYCEDGHSDESTINIPTPPALRDRFVLSAEELEELGSWLLSIERHYGRPMDIEWAKDGVTNKMWIVQARPETVRSQETHLSISEYKLEERGELLAKGISVGNKIISGHARLLNSPEEQASLKKGDILVTDITSPDWDPLLKRAGAIVTNKGGRTSHAAIVAREFGTPAVVGAVNATARIKDDEMVTVVCTSDGSGEIYRGELKFSRQDREIGKITMPQTKPMLILGDPDQAFRLSFYPNQGVGLLRLEFIITNAIQIHPMALVNYPYLNDESARRQIEELTRGYADKKDYFVEKLSEGVARIAAAFYPKDVIVRMSDFKTNEYAGLIGGAEFEPDEENPMLGFRGASRYYDPRYRPGFELECKAMKRVRDEMGLTNVKLMIPFCRTVAEGRKVIEVMETQGLRRSPNKDNGLEIYVMAELPSNIILAKQFAEVFDGFSIGSNDLTQLTLGIDRDSATVSSHFDERNEAPMTMISMMIESARAAGRKIGLCGQAPSDHPDFAEFLVNKGIDSISFNPDALLQGIENISKAERKHQATNSLVNGSLRAQRNGSARVRTNAS